jgi:hypothetical protein
VFASILIHIIVDWKWLHPTELIVAFIGLGLCLYISVDILLEAQVHLRAKP